MSKYIESESLELKEKYTDVLCKEIVSFLNTNGGQIIIGVKDDGGIVGVDKIDETLKKIADVISDQIEPSPVDEVKSELKFEEGKVLIVINIQKGMKHVYCIKKYGFSSSGCFVRVGSTCREMSLEQIKIRYEKKFIDKDYMVQRKSNLLDLSFRELKIYYSEHGYHLSDNTFDANLNLKTGDGNYNLLAELLADYNNIPLIFVKFRGIDKSAISKRNDYGCGCLITSYEKIKNRIEAENICYSDTTKRPRVDNYLYNFDCVNEAIINALVHNDWTITEPQISMFEDRIEILSHGGLFGLSKEQFFEGISKPRNASLMRIFLNLGLCEHTGHGVPTIVKVYGKEVFDINENYIRCTIPFDKSVVDYKKPKVDYNSLIRLNKNEEEVLISLVENNSCSNDDLATKVGVSKRTIERAIASLKEKHMIERVGNRKNGYWLVCK